MAHHPKDRIRDLARCAIYRNSARAKMLKEKRVNRRKEFVWRYKMAAGCFDCGYAENAWALELDHVTGIKSGTIGLFYHQSWAKLLNELAKCQVRCANCHAIVTHQRKDIF